MPICKHEDFLLSTNNYRNLLGIDHGSKYLPIIKQAKYIGSFFVTRAIKIGKEKTDERLNEITINNNKVISILSGKWNTCVGVAKKIDKMLV